MVPPSSHRVPRVRRYSGSGRTALSFVYGALTLFGAPSHALPLDLAVPYAVLNPGGIATAGLALSPFARHYSGTLG